MGGWVIGGCSLAGLCAERHAGCTACVELQPQPPRLKPAPLHPPTHPPTVPQASDDGARDYRLVVQRYYEREAGLAMGRYNKGGRWGGRLMCTCVLLRLQQSLVCAAAACLPASRSAAACL